MNHLFVWGFAAGACALPYAKTARVAAQAAEAALIRETGIDYQPTSPETLVTFNLEDADLPELVRTISQISGKRFILPRRDDGVSVANVHDHGAVGMPMFEKTCDLAQ